MGWKNSRYIRILRQHWTMSLLAVVGLILIFTNLGSDFLWEDEGDTAVLASNILKFGVPKAWDGVAFIDADQGARLNNHLVMVAHPWIPYYVTAAAFWIFGQNSFAARLPFATAGWISILCVYWFVWRICLSRLTGFCASFLLICSVQFLLYTRQCRYYSLNMLLTIWLFWIFFSLKSMRSCALFAIVAILSFHVHPYGLVPVFALAGLTLFYKPFASQRRYFWFSVPIIATFTVPWLVFSPSSTGINVDSIHSVGEFIERLIQAFIEYTSVTPLIGTAILFLICITLRRSRHGTDYSINPRDISLLITVLVTLFVYIGATAITQSSEGLWLGGIRYASPMLPLACVAAALIIVKVSRAKMAVWLPLLAIFAFTTLAQLTPWMAWNRTGLVKFGKYTVAAHVPLKLADHFFGTGLLRFVRDLRHDNPGTLAKTYQFLRENAKPGDAVIINSGMEPIYFYTRLPQALAILPQYPIYETARQLGLPEYVFSIDHARWIVWRSAWEGAAGYRIKNIVQQIIDRGGRVTMVMEMEETVWENREDVYFHRFSDGSYLSPLPKAEGMPLAQIGRVDWPSE